MIKKILSVLLAPFRWIKNRMSGIKKWIDDPFTNGKIRLPPIFSLSHIQPLASRRQSLIFIPLYNLLIGGWNFLVSEVLGRLAHLAKVLIGIGKGYNKGGYDYVGAFLSWSLSLLNRGFSALVSFLRAIFKMLR